MFDFLKKIFNKTFPVAEGEPIRIDITGKNIVINEKNKLTLPVDIDTMVKIFGNPRAMQFDTKMDDKNFLDSMYGQNTVTNRVNYIWDQLGIKCYTLNGKTVTTFGIELNKGTLDYPHVSEKLFNGKITINGKHWLPIVKAGEDCEVIQHVYLGKYLLTCEYVDFEQEMTYRTEKDYTGIEIGLR